VNVRIIFQKHCKKSLLNVDFKLNNIYVNFIFRTYKKKTKKLWLMEILVIRHGAGP